MVAVWYLFDILCMCISNGICVFLMVSIICARGIAMVTVEFHWYPCVITMITTVCGLSMLSVVFLWYPTDIYVAIQCYICGIPILS